MSRYDLVVIGGGTAGITAAIGAAGVGARVLLAEQDRVGGDCLWTGCVPSKALIAAARRVHDMRTADRLGLPAHDPHIDLAPIMARVHEAIATIEPHDSPDRLRSLGVEVVLARARFEQPGRIDVNGRTVDYRTALVATGTAPRLPRIPGLAEIDPLTSDTLWDLKELPERLAIIGCGSIGSELGQAFARLGSTVTIVETADRLLPTVPAEASAVLADVFRAEGVDVRARTRVRSVDPGRLATTGPDGVDATIGFDRLLVAAGRTPRTGALGLERVGVEVDDNGHVKVDDTLRTTGRNIFAAGDVTGRLPFTHVAGAHAAVVVTNALFRTRRTVNEDHVPWVIFADPEIAHVGLDADGARRRWGDDAIISRHDHHDLDRAVTSGQTTGFATLVADPRGRLVGATVVGEAAGESIAELAAWIRRRGRLRDLGTTIHAYPTMSEGPWRAALEHLRGTYLSQRTRRWTRLPLWLLRQLDRPRT